MAELSEFPVDSTPPQLAYWIHQQVQQMTNNILKFRGSKKAKLTQQPIE
jgi:hypothetical protein